MLCYNVVRQTDNCLFPFTNNTRDDWWPDGTCLAEKIALS